MAGCDQIFNLAADMGGMGYVDVAHFPPFFLLFDLSPSSTFLLRPRRSPSPHPLPRLPNFPTVPPCNSFIQSNHSVIMYNNTMISFNMLEVARIAGVKRFFYASSACIYPEYKQLDVEVEGGGLKEGDAWPAQPQDAYGE